MSNTFRPSAPVKHTVIEEGSEFKGSLSSSCPVDVRGRVEGELATPALTVSSSGSVHGRAKVGSVRSEGELSGEFDADTIELAGSVRDNTVIRARSLEVKLSSERGKLQVIFGETELSVGDEPTEHDRVEPVLSPEQPVEAPAMMAPGAEAQPIADLPALAGGAPSSVEGEDGDDDGDEAHVSPDGAEEPPAGKRRRKRKDGSAQAETAEGGWTQPPSQPPPPN